MRTKEIGNSLGRYAVLAIATTALSSCGWSSGDTSEATGSGGAEVAGNDTRTAEAGGGNAGAPAKALPIAVGIYGDTQWGDCGKTKRAFFYDGANYGYVMPAEPGFQDEAYFESNRIVRVGPPSRDSEFFEDYRGYTLVWHAENADTDEDILGLKAGRNGRIEAMSVSDGPKGYMYSDEAFQKCSFAQLSPSMQAAFRAKVPKLADGKAPAAAKASIGFPPIPQGFYAYGSSCAEAIASGEGGDPPIGLVKFTSKGIGEWDGTMQISGFDDIGNGRYRVRGRSFGNGDDPVGESSDFTIRVTGPASFFDDATQQEHRHCPNVPANVREQYM
ncbi:hypothetical protein [Parerythrobacter lacustris]|uniref:Uncharacterized protein n=1 Tax=Parerythrobacter lacustris TaxID=2969984 RepID=A0ABT1XNK8_9SPHN|nr:hypothetical protein [Parerythrobacter lacustris]MCR2832844.1 hypothetical protein [Parerythrobacter lacustris]